MPLSKPAEKAKPKAKTTAVIPVKKTTKPKAKPVVKVTKPVTVEEVMQVQQSVVPPWLDDEPKLIQTNKVMGVSEFLKAAGIRA